MHHSSLRAFHCLTFLLTFLVNVSIAYTGGNPSSLPSNNNSKNKDTPTSLNDKQKSSPLSFPVAPPFPPIASADGNKQDLINVGRSSKLSYPERPLAPPFPDGLNGGQLITLPPSEHYLLDSNLSGNTLLLPPRDIQVWLPPDYNKYPNMNFPVLYCHDGQNAIFDSSSWTGFSWRLAGCLTRLSERKLLTRTTPTHSPPIVVMIPCADERIASLVPRRHLEYGDISQTFAQAHADFVALTLKPLIDSKFRTLKSVEHTSTIGSSLGGQASFHLLVRHPNVFGNAACLSPAFQPSILTAVATTTSTLLKRKRIYIDNGGDEEDKKVPLVDLVDFMSKDHWWNPGYWWLDTSLQPSIDAMKLVLDAKGLKYAYNKIPGGRHNERAWALRIHKPLLALYSNDKQIDA